MEIRGSYILFFNQSLAIHHLKYSYNYQNIFQVFFTTNVDHCVSTANFIKIIPAVPLPVCWGCEKYAFVVHTHRECKHITKSHFPGEIRSSMQILSSDEKCLEHWTANKCNIIKVTNSFLFLCSFYVYVINPDYLRTAGQRCNNSLKQQEKLKYGGNKTS